MCSKLKQNGKEVEPRGMLNVLTPDGPVSLPWRGPGAIKGHPITCARVESVRPKENGKPTYWESRGYSPVAFLVDGFKEGEIWFNGRGHLAGMSDGKQVVVMTRPATPVETEYFKGHDRVPQEFGPEHEEYLKRFTG